ncbi:MAG: class I SAM-dependent methyltransferase [Gemmatimonadetes bacterium]|nr:class I SAM-dependent methyltransferase [Gemmatimonadota bacterium]
MSRRPLVRPPTDRSNGYEAVAADFMAHRTSSAVGASIVREWASSLPRGAAVLDLGCGHGVPISEVLYAGGAALYGVDASPTMITAFRARFPDAHAECNAAEDSELFGRTFDGVVAWGLLFLLTPEAQARVIASVAAALSPGGRFLFTSPAPPCAWLDTLTGKRSVSLGADEYRRLLRGAGLDVLGNSEDEGSNYYHSAVKGG